MADTYIEYTGDGSTVEYTFPFEYLDASHVKVEVAGAPAGFTFLSQNIILLDSAPASGEAVRIYRETSHASMVTWAPGGNLTRDDMELARKQALFIAIEAFDKALDAHVRTLLPGPQGPEGPQGPQGPEGPASTIPGPPGPTGDGTGDMLAENNLSDLTDVAAARTNLGLGTAALAASSDFAAATHSHAISDVTGLQTALDGKAAASHNHDSRYYTESEIDTALAGKANTTHNHDDRYYTETEIDAALADKAAATHSHTISSVAGLQTALNARVSSVSMADAYSGTGYSIRLANITATINSSTGVLTITRHWQYYDAGGGGE